MENEEQQGASPDQSIDEQDEALEIKPTVADEEAAAAEEAGAIGGKGGAEEVTDEAERPVAEGGGGESEGFELAERDLEEHATNIESPNPLDEAFTPEQERSDAEYGEADEERSSEDEAE